MNRRTAKRVLKASQALQGCIGILIHETVDMAWDKEKGKRYGKKDCEKIGDIVRALAEARSSLGELENEARKAVDNGQGC